MSRAPFFPSLDAGVNDRGFHSRSLLTPELYRLPRMSVLANVKLPYLRRSESANPSGTVHKVPLLTLKLSSHSLLDSTLKDDASVSPLYTVTTVGVTTTILRADPWQKSVKTASIKWPKVIPAKGKGKNAPDGVLVQLKGCPWKGGDSFLKPSASKSGSRKFDLPHYSHSMKWQKQGTAYWCNSSPVKGPIAVFDPPVDQLPGRLTIYETLHDKYETSPMLVHQSVSIFLLDYLLVTAILLVTNPQEWMVVQSTSSCTTSSGDAQSNAGLQWRKIAHGEPLFPKLSPPAIRQPETLGLNNNPATPTKEQMAKVVHRDPLFPQIGPGLKSVLSFSSHSDEDGNDDSHSDVTRPRSPSPFTDMPFYPMPDNVSTSQTTIDPSVSLNHDLSSHYSSQTRSPSLSSTGSWLVPAQRNASPSQVPLDVPHTRIHRRSALISESNDMAESSLSVGPADASLWKRRPSEPVIMRARSVTRPLPQTPDALGADGRVIRRVQSHNRINENIDIRKPWMLTSPPPLPPIPFTQASPRTPRTGRSLPPTPFDLAMGRSTGGSNAPTASGVQILRKSFDSDEDISRWVQMFGGAEQGASDPVLPRPSFDQPPPAYSSIDFATSHQQPWTRGS